MPTLELASISAAKASTTMDLAVVKRTGDIVVLSAPISGGTAEPSGITLDTPQGSHSLASTSAGAATVSMGMGSQQAVFSTSAGRSTVSQSLGIGVHLTNTPATGAGGASQRMLVIRASDFFSIYPSAPPYAPLDVLLATRTGPPILTPVIGNSQGSATAAGSLSTNNALAGTSSGNGTVVHTQPVPIETASTGSSTATGDLTRHTVAASVSSDAVVTADIVLSVALNGGASGAATTNGILAKIQILVASSSATSTVTGDVTYLQPMAGAATCPSSVSGDLSRHVLRGSALGFTTILANLGGSFTYEVYPIGTTAAAATLGLTFNFATATIATAATVTGNLTFPRDLSTAISSGESTVVGNLLVYILSGQNASTASVAGHLHYLNDIVPLAAISAGATTVAGQDRERFRLIPQVSVGTSTVTGQVRRLWTLAGTPAGLATVAFDHLTIHTIPPGPVTCFATVVGEAIMDSKFGGDSHGVASLVINTYATYRLGMAASQGVADVHGRLGVHPQDFEVGPCSGSAVVHGQILLGVLTLRALSQGGRLPLPSGSFNDILVVAGLGIAFTFPGTARSNGSSEVEAILLLNDSGLIRGNSRIDASLNRLSTEYSGHVAAFAMTRLAYLDRPGDLSAEVNDAYAGVGRWYPGSVFFQQLYYDEGAGRMSPFRNDLPTTDPNYDSGIYHPGSNSFRVFNNTERRYAHQWDGTYASFTRVDTPNLPSDPWYVDPDQTGISPGNTRLLNGPFPGALRRRYQLADPGQLGGWFVDAVPFNYRDIAMRAAPVGEARFSEPQSTVDMNLELKSSMKGVITGNATVAALALLLSFRHIMATGNVTALRYLLQTHEGNVTKSKDTRLPISQKNSEQIQPIHQTNALFV